MRRTRAIFLEILWRFQSTARKAIGRGAALVVIASVLPIATAANPRQAAVVRLDGAIVQGNWQGIGTKDELRLSGVDGEVVIPLDDVRSVSFDHQRASRDRCSVVFHLADGGRLAGELLAGDGDAVIARTALGDSSRFSWDRLSAIQLGDSARFGRAYAALSNALSNRSPSQDELISRDDTEVKRLLGRLESLDAAGGSFFFDGESRRFQNEKVFAIVLAAGARKQGPFAATFELVDGSVFSGTLESADEEVLKVETSVGTISNISVGDIVAVRFRAERLAFLSDLDPTNQVIEGLIHDPWRVQRDKNLLGGALSIGGRTFARGLGVHSRTEITYKLNEAFDRFAATIGIDDAVRPLGSVVMRVMGDTRILFDSGEVRGTDPARDILVDVAGIGELTLIVDYGEGLDVSDHADWGDARLIRSRGHGRRTPKPD